VQELVPSEKICVHLIGDPCERGSWGRRVKSGELESEIIASPVDRLTKDWQRLGVDSPWSVWSERRYAIDSLGGHGGVRPVVPRGQQKLKGNDVGVVDIYHQASVEYRPLLKKRVRRIAYARRPARSPIWCRID
jgi:hypothetical protein